VTLLLRRAWTFRGYLALLGTLTLVATALIVGVPRIANDLTDIGLRERIGGLPYQVRDLTYEQTVTPTGGALPESPRGWLAQQWRSFDEPLAGLVRDAWYSAQVGPSGLVANGAGMPVNGNALPAIGLREQTGIAGAATVTAGRWPEATRTGDALEAAVSVDVAAVMKLRPGSRFELGRVGPERLPIEIVVVGVFAARDAGDPLWDPEPELLRPFVPVGQDNVPYRGVLVVEETAVTTGAAVGWPVTYGWRYRIDADRLDAGMLDPLTTAVADARQAPPLRATTTTGLDTALAEFAGRVSATRALLAVVGSGVLATLVGLALLAAAAAVDRRRTELALLRARGGATATVGGRLISESLLVVPVAAVGGWLIAAQAPGRPAGTQWLVVAYALVAAAAAPVLGMAAHARISPTTRRDLATRRSSPARLTAEVSLLAAAAVGVLLLRRRGLGAAEGVDPYLVSVPVLLAAAAAVLALRAYPPPMRWLGRLAARSRGSVAFLGFSRAGRAAPATIGPVAVLVVAIATGMFSAVVTSTLDEARDRATDTTIGADLRMVGGPFTPETTERVAATAGVTAVAPLATGVARPVLSGVGPEARRLGQALVVAVDAPAFARVVAVSGVRLDLPAELVAARRGDGPVPAVVSPELAAKTRVAGATDLQGVLFRFRVAAVAEEFPSLQATGGPFVVLPLQALPVSETKPVLPTGFLVAGANADRAALVETGDQGHRDWLAGVALGAESAGVTGVVSRAEYRRELERSGLNGVLRFTFAAGAVGGTALALLAVGFTVLTGAAARGRALSRLRTMGMSGGQGRRLLALELAPLVGVGVIAGAAIGAALPALLAPALGLRAFAAGRPVGVHLDPTVVAATLGLVLLGLATALATEYAINRRLRLGDVLRLGEEN
jgi:putative ABC transport system permease protein